MLEQLTSEQLQELLSRFVNVLMEMLQLKIREIVLFGSYARGDADEEPDVDLMILTDIPRDEIPSFRHYISHVAAELGLEYGPMVSPIMQNYDFFTQWTETLPIYRNVRAERVSLHAA